MGPLHRKRTSAGLLLYLCRNPIMNEHFSCSIANGRMSSKPGFAIVVNHPPRITGILTGPGWKPNERTGKSPQSPGIRI